VTKETKVKSEWKARKETWDRRENAVLLVQQASMEPKVLRVQKVLKDQQVKPDPLDLQERKERLVNLVLLDIQVDLVTREIREHKAEMGHLVEKEKEAKMVCLEKEV